MSHNTYTTSIERLKNFGYLIYVDEIYPNMSGYVFIERPHDVEELNN